MLGPQYTFVDLAAGKSPGSPNLYVRRDRDRAGLSLSAEEGTNMQTLVIYELGFNQNYYTFI